MGIVFKDDLKSHLYCELNKRTDVYGYVTLIDEFRIGGVKVRKELLSILINELIDDYFSNREDESNEK